MMEAIGSSGGQWHFTAVLVYGGKAAVVKMVSGSGSSGWWGWAQNNQQMILYNGQWQGGGDIERGNATIKLK
jgi:hypothetical protein